MSVEGKKKIFIAFPLGTRHSSLDTRVRHCLKAFLPANFAEVPSSSSMRNNFSLMVNVLCRLDAQPGR
jgi:hypothetical protein